MQGGNLFSHLPEGPIPAEAFESLASGGGCRIERIVSTGHATPDGEWMEQDWDEWVLLVAGGAALTFEGGGRAASSGARRLAAHPGRHPPSRCLDVPVGSHGVARGPLSGAVTRHRDVTPPGARPEAQGESLNPRSALAHGAGI